MTISTSSPNSSSASAVPTSTTIGSSASKSIRDTVAGGIDQAYARVHNYAQNVYFQDGLLLTGILAGLLYLIVAISLDAAGYVQSMALLIPITLGALALGTLMAFSRFDGFFALSHSLFTGLAWILFWMLGLVPEEELVQIMSNGIPEFQARAYYILIRWVNWVELAINNSAKAENYVFIFEISFLLWWLTYLGTWAILRYGYTWRAVIPAGIVLLINTYYAPNSIMGFLLVFCFLALILLIRTHLAEQQRRWREQRIYFNPDISWDFLRNGFFISLAIVTFASIAPGLGRSSQVRYILEPVNRGWEQATETLREWYPDINARTRPTGSAFGRSLSLGGARNVGNRPVFQVSTVQGRYWRAVAYDTFDGQKWWNTAEAEIQFAAEERVPVGNWSLRNPITQTITLLSPTGSVIFGAPDIYQTDVPITGLYQNVPIPSLINTAETLDQAGTQGIELTWARSDRLLDVGDSYTVLSRYADVTERALRSTEGFYPADIEERYLQLPENFSERVAQDAHDLMDGYDTVYDKAKALETFLRGFEYNEEIEAPPEGRDPIEYFLYDIQEGYCDYYASSMVTMLRSVGIPSRTASGYAEGTLDEETGLYTITERDAHTWVEVYFPGFGWIEFEPTAGESVLDRPLDAELQDSGLIPGMPEQEDPFPFDGEIPQFLEDEFPLDDIFPEDPIGADQIPVNRRPWWMGVLVSLAAILVVGFLVLRSTVFGPISFTPDMPPILFDRMQRWTERLGIRTAAGFTPYEQARQFVRVLPEGRRPIEQITNGYVLYQFSDQQSANDSFISQNSALRAKAELPRAWQTLHSLFWCTWLRQIMGKFSRRSTNRFELME